MIEPKRDLGKQVGAVLSAAQALSCTMIQNGTSIPLPSMLRARMAYVGRIREDGSDPERDNPDRFGRFAHGAALNAVQSRSF